MPHGIFFFGVVQLACPIPSYIASYHVAGGMKPKTRLALDSAKWLRLPSRLLEYALLPSLGAYFGRLLVILQSVCDKTIWNLTDNYSLYAAACISWLRACHQPQGAWHKGNQRTQSHPAGGVRGWVRATWLEHKIDLCLCVLAWVSQFVFLIKNKNKNKTLEKLEK